MEKTTSPLNSPIFLVPKDPNNPDPDRHFRPVVDQRLVNGLFEKISTDYPPLKEYLQRLSSARFVSAFDLQAGFHQIRVRPEDRK